MKPFFQDDFWFLKIARAESLADYVGFWNVRRGWFFRPVFLTWFATIYALAGPHPFWFHAGSLALHAAVITALSLLVWRLTKNTLVAFLSAAAFLLWPLKSEAVWWICSASTLLAALFSLIALHTWLSWRQSQRKGFYLATLAAFTLALCSKNDAASLPAALLLMDFYCATPWRTNFKKRVLEFLPVGILFLFFVKAESIAARTYAEVGDQYVQTFYHATLDLRFRILAFFWDKLLGGALPVAPMGLTTLIVLVCVGLLIRYLSQLKLANGRALVFFALWAFMAALPVPLAAAWHALSERFYYIPLVSLCCAIVLLLDGVARGLRQGDVVCRLFAVVIMTPVVASYLPLRVLTSNDPGVVWLSLIALVGLSFALWRAGKIDAELLAVVTLVSVFTQVSIYGGLSSTAALIFVIVAVVAMKWQQRSWFIVALLAAVFWHFSAFAMLLALLLDAVMLQLPHAISYRLRLPAPLTIGRVSENRPSLTTQVKA